MKHFTDEYEEAIYKTVEEAGEVVKAAMKMLQHGARSYNPTNPSMGDNRRHFSKELGDMLGLIKWCFENGLVDQYHFQEAARTKMHRVAKYAHNIKVPTDYVPRDI